MTGQPPDWQLILDAAEALTASEQAPFTRMSVYEWIWRRYPRSDHDRPSLDPAFQGMVDNARAAQPVRDTAAPDRARPLHSRRIPARRRRASRGRCPPPGRPRRGGPL